MNGDNFADIIVSQLEGGEGIVMLQRKETNGSFCAGCEDEKLSVWQNFGITHHILNHMEILIMQFA